MKLPSIFWDDDMQARFNVAQDRMDDIKKNPIQIPGGAAQASDRGAFYSPKEQALTVKETFVRQKPAA